MFTTAMYDRLSEWSSTMSLLLLATVVLPAWFGITEEPFGGEVYIGLGMSVFSLWLSLRFARVSERRR